MMNHSQVVSLLRQIVTELEPYTSLPLHSTSSTDQGQFGPEASRQSEISAVQGWSKTLEQFAAEVEKHNGPLPERERETIGSNLFGGMGSFTDFYLDERIFGSRAKATNERLMALTGAKLRSCRSRLTFLNELSGFSLSILAGAGQML